MTNPLSEAIQDHVNTYWGGDLTTDWVLVVATIDPDGNTGLGTIPSRDPMPGYVLKGLLTEAIDYTRDGMFQYDGDDDD